MGVNAPPEATSAELTVFNVQVGLGNGRFRLWNGFTAAKVRIRQLGALCFVHDISINLQVGFTSLLVTTLTVLSHLVNLFGPGKIICKDDVSLDVVTRRRQGNAQTRAGFDAKGTSLVGYVFNADWVLSQRVKQTSGISASCDKFNHSFPSVYPHQRPKPNWPLKRASWLFFSTFSTQVRVTPKDTR